jgi:hypothetical protein
MNKPIRAALLTAKALYDKLPHVVGGGAPMAKGGVAKDIPQIIMPGDHPARIDTRLATGAKPLDLGAGPRVVNLNALRATPALFDKNVDILRSYPNISEEATRMSNHDLADHFVGHVKDNLLWLHDQVPDETRQRSKQWYDGANKLAKEWAKKYGVSEAAAAGALAALSPQKDWFQNVSLAERVMNVMKGRGDNAYHGETFSPEMEKTYRGLEALATEKNEPIFQAIKGKSLGDIDKMKHLPGDERATLKALWIRMHDQTHNDPSYKIATPEGHFGELARNADGSPSKAGWGSLGEIAKAVQSIESNGEPTFMNRLMGERHKVRNFYNNILDPHSPHGDVTIDTHAVAAGLLRALSGNSLEVAHNFNNYAGKGVPGAGGSNATGVNGTYPLYADAYRQAAKERGILPREMQSITWEAIRGLFPDTFKTAKNNKHLDSIWNDYRHGRKGIDDVRKEIHDFAGGIRPPEWHDTSGTPDAPVRSAGDAGVIPGPGSRGPAPIGIVGGTGDGPPGAPAPQAPRSSGLILPPSYACGGMIDKALAATRPR